ncbi:MAG: twin-arginine translocase TatA/TatE family subunit [Chloroflexi bacterium]|nr:twin-arginine translocase TatA/TatE family subunit [Chloroflexota bacterium]
MFDVGIPELILVLVVALVVFGPGKLPEIGSGLGKAVRDFRRMTQGITDEIHAVTNLEAEDEMRTRLISEPSAKESAAAGSVETAQSSGASGPAETKS